MVGFRRVQKVKKKRKNGPRIGRGMGNVPKRRRRPACITGLEREMSRQCREDSVGGAVGRLSRAAGSGGVRRMGRDQALDRWQTTGSARSGELQRERQAGKVESRSDDDRCRLRRFSCHWTVSGLVLIGSRRLMIELSADEGGLLLVCVSPSLLPTRFHSWSTLHPAASAHLALLLLCVCQCVNLILS